MSSQQISMTDPSYDRLFMDRCMSKVVVDQNGCWIWTAGKDQKGYGQTAYRKRHTRAHRAFYIAKLGPVPVGLHVCHKCDVPACINPDHMFLGTPRDNLRDMATKGRHKEQQKTHCPQGHEYTPENTFRKKSATTFERSCRTCKDTHDKAKHERIKQGIAPKRYRNNAALITVDGVTRTRAEWAAALRISAPAVSYRLLPGGMWHGVAIVTPPPPGRRKLAHY